MIYLKTYEDLQSNDDRGYVVNGMFFLAGFQENMFIELSDDDKTKLKGILIKISEKYKDYLYIDFVGTWLHGPFAAKYGVWIPGYTFQSAFTSIASAKKASEDLVREFKSVSEGPICIAIAHGDIQVNFDDPINSDGTAYHRSGRYIDDPNNCLKMIRDKETIKVV